MTEITTREQLAGALTVAAELEHGLLIQYLFAAYSLKKSPAEGITDAQADTCRLWEGTILRVARDEMAHLANVCNLLSAIGEAPHLLRPNYPQDVNASSPFEFELTKFSEKTLYRFARAEAPGTQPPTATEVPDQSDSILFHYTDELYGKIKDGFDRVVQAIGESRAVHRAQVRAGHVGLVEPVSNPADPHVEGSLRRDRRDRAAGRRRARQRERLALRSVRDDAHQPGGREASRCRNSYPPAGWRPTRA